MAYKFAAFATFSNRMAAQAAVDELQAATGDLDVSVKVFERSEGDVGEDAIATILTGLMNNSTRAESDVRRGVRIGLLVGATLGTGFGYLLSRLLEFGEGFGLLLGFVMGTTVGALMSGIVGAGLVNPRLARALRALEVGQALVSVCTRNREQHARVVQGLRSGSVALATGGRG